jgi:predicted permease
MSVMTYNAWMRVGADPKIIGKTIGSNVIVGVAPKEFTGSMYGVNGDLLTSFASADDHGNSWFEQRNVRRLMLIARLKPGVTRQQAQAEMTALSAQLASAYPKENKDITAVVTRATLLPPDAIPDAELMIGALMAGVCLVLLIACANVANLLLTIAIGRRQEAAIKLALGIQRARLVREFLTETAMICGVSAVLGILAASFLISQYSDVRFDFPGLGGSYAFGTNLHIDATVGALTFGVMIIAIAVSGIVPALYASAPNLAHILSGEIVVGGTRKIFRRNLLVIAEVAVCTTVMVGMGLCERSLYNLRHADTGFTTRNLIAVTLVLPEEPSDGRWKQFYPRVRQSISSLPGVESISFAQSLPLLFGYRQGQAQIPGSDQKMAVSETSVDDQYFSTFGIQIISGRPFDSVEREPSQQVVMINHTLAEKSWPGQEAVGKSILAGDPPRPLLVIGVTADGKYSSVYESPQSVVYYPLDTRDLNSVTLVAKTQGDPRLWVESVDQTMRALGAVGPWHPVTYGEWVDFSLLGERIAAGVLAVISGLGLLLAMLGLFCTISYSVSQRKREFGIRVALGAERRQLLHMILQQTSVITGAGVIIGVVFGIAATLLLRAQFYGISTVEWTVLVPVSIAMLGLSLFVAYCSARPWISIDPMEAVRHA